MAKKDKAQKKAEKQAKKEQKKQQKAEGGKKGGKKKLLLLIPVVAAVGAGVYFFVLKGGSLPFLGGGVDKTKVDVYAVGDEMVASISAMEGAGAETLMSITTNVAPPSEEEQAASEGEDDEKDAEDAPYRGEAQVITEENSDGTLWTNYYYQITEDTVADLAAYTEFLTGEGFKMTGGGGSTEETAAFGVYEKSAATREKYIFSIELEYPLAGDIATGQFAIKARMAEKEELIEENVPTMSRDEAMEFFAQQDYTKLGLEYPVSEYNMTVDMGRTYIDGKDCYGINIYSRGNGPDGGNFVKKFYLSLSDKKIYEYLNNDIFDLQSVSSSYPNITHTSTMPSNQESTANPNGSMRDWQFDAQQ